MYDYCIVLIPAVCRAMQSAEQTPLTALRLGELALQAGLPPGALNILSGAFPSTTSSRSQLRSPTRLLQSDASSGSGCRASHFRCFATSSHKAAGPFEYVTAAVHA